MQIAWRYEALGNSSSAPGAMRAESASTATFCHSFDLGKRLAASACKGSMHPTPASCLPPFQVEAPDSPSPLKAILRHLRGKLENSPPTEIHRLVVPSLLSPLLYASSCVQPAEVLQFLQGLRALLRQFNNQLTALLTFPTSLFPRSSGLVRWIELLCDGVVELIPLPANPGAAAPVDKKDAKAAEQPQGLLRVHTLPVYHERGGGGAETSSFRETLSFSLSASKGLTIKPYSLPPMVDDEHKEKSPASTVKDGLDF